MVLCAPWFYIEIIGFRMFLLHSQTTRTAPVIERSSTLTFQFPFRTVTMENYKKIPEASLPVAEIGQRCFTKPKRSPQNAGPGRGTVSTSRRSTTLVTQIASLLATSPSSQDNCNLEEAVKLLKELRKKTKNCKGPSLNYTMKSRNSV